MRLNQTRMFTVRKLFVVLKYGASALFVFFVIGLLRGSGESGDAHQELPHGKEYLAEDVKLFEAMIAEDEARVVPGWGEMGGAVTLRGDDLAKGELSFKNYAVNIYLSDRISLNRTLADYRDPKCRKVLYDAQLPSASVIIIFHNEPYSVLLRTVWSVLNSARRTRPWFAHTRFYDIGASADGQPEFIGSPGSDPKSEYVYLKEIILVDDNSTLPELRGKLGYYVRTRFPQDVVKLIRLPNRQGLIRARLAGARKARGDVLVFLDAHCEPAPDWLRPLLQRSKYLRQTALVPIIDLVDANNMEYSTNGVDNFQVGGFDFDGQFTWIDVSPEEKKRRGSDIAPTWSPTMAGGLFAIDRKYFWEIGSYDEQMDGWGGENLEMSFRIWQCGGTLETIPCSRVGHIFRAFHPYKFPGDRDTHGINTVRLAKVWMDDYADIFFLHRSDLLDYDVGDLTHRKVLREKLKCKSFKWYLEHIYKDKFIPTKNVFGYGRVLHPRKKFCIDTMQREDEQSVLGVYPCHEKMSVTQFFSFTLKGELRTEQMCAQIQYRRNKKVVHDVVMDKCHGKKRDQEWMVIPKKNSRYSIMHVKTGCCLDIFNNKNSNLQARKCDNSSDSQIWLIEFNQHNNFSKINNPVISVFEQSGFELSDEISTKGAEFVDNKKPAQQANPIQELKAQANKIPHDLKEAIQVFQKRKLRAVFDDEDGSANDEMTAKHPTIPTTVRSTTHRKKNGRNGKRNGRNRNRGDVKNAKRRGDHGRRKHQDDDQVEEKPAIRRHRARGKGRRGKDEGRRNGRRNRKSHDREKDAEGEYKAGSVWKKSSTLRTLEESEEGAHGAKGKGGRGKKHTTVSSQDSNIDQRPNNIIDNGEDKDYNGKKSPSNENQADGRKKKSPKNKKQTPATISPFDVGKDSDLDALSMNEMASIDSVEGHGVVGVDNNAAQAQKTVETTNASQKKYKPKADSFERYKEVQENENSDTVNNDNASAPKDVDTKQHVDATPVAPTTLATTKEPRARRVVPKRDRVVYKKYDYSYEDQ